MINKIVKLGTSILLLVTLMLPSTIAVAAESEDGWTTLASMKTLRQDFTTEIINGKIYVFGSGNTGSSFKSTTEMYDPAINTWTALAPMSNSRNYHQTEMIDGKIYAIGGLFDRKRLSSVEVYDPAQDRWTSVASMPTPRTSFQTEVIDGKIYAIGGNNSNELSSVVVYDPTEDKWTSLAPMAISRSHHQTEVIGGKIYVIGGVTNSTQFLSSVEVYDPAQDKWSSLAPMSTTRYDHKTEVIDGKIYAIGGHNGSFISKTEVYDPTEDKWTSVASIPTPRAAFQTDVIGGKIYVTGGGSPSTLSSVEVYDPTHDTWTSLAPMSTTRRDHKTEVIEGKIYAIGGNGLTSMEVYSIPSNNTKKLKVVLEVNEHLQLTVDDNINNNINVTWTSSNDAVASVDENGVVTALATGNATITVSDGKGYTDSINILVVENADAHRLAIDLHIGNTSRLTVDDYTNSVIATWASSDPSIATITNVGRVTAVSTGLTLITATDEDKNQIGQAYVRVRA